MSLALFHEVPAGAIETFFNERNRPLFKRADLGSYLGIRNITSRNLHRTIPAPGLKERVSVKP